jgi:hypothetical protein
MSVNRSNGVPGPPPAAPEAKASDAPSPAAPVAAKTQSVPAEAARFQGPGITPAQLKAVLAALGQVAVSPQGEVAEAEAVAPGDGQTPKGVDGFAKMPVPATAAPLKTALLAGTPIHDATGKPVVVLTTSQAATASAEAVITQFVGELVAPKTMPPGVAPLRLEQRATRLIAFLRPYAEQLSKLELPREARAQVAASLARPVVESRVLENVKVEGKSTTATAVMAEMLSAESPAAVREASTQTLVVSRPNEPATATIVQSQGKSIEHSPTEVEPASRRRSSSRGGVWGFVSGALDWAKNPDDAVENDQFQQLVATGVVVIAICLMGLIALTLLR